MRLKYFIGFCLIIIGSISCDKSEDNINIDSIIDTNWKLTQIINNAGKTSNFPSDIDNFEIAFQKNGEINLTNLCNYSFGVYSVTDNDSLIIYNVGEGTEKYCLPDTSMDWETLFINSLISAETYFITNNKLTINCQDNQLVFDFISKYDSNKGEVYFALMRI